MLFRSLGEYGNATICDVDDPEDISRGFRSLIARRFDGSLHGSKTPAETDAFANRFSRKELARQLADTLRALVPGGQGR